jgi:superfamily II DNA or RNA helicase
VYSLPHTRDNLLVKLEISNSFCKLSGDIPQVVTDVLTQVMTYQNDIAAEVGQLFFQMKLARRYGNNKKFYAAKAQVEKLQANEFVCLYKNQRFPTGLLNIALEVFKELNAAVDCIDLRQQPGETAILRWNNMPWEPRYYQKEMIQLGIEAGRGVFEAAVGSGKSLIMGYLIKHFSCRSLVIVPSVGLSGQLYNDLSSWFGVQNVELLDAAKIRKTKKPKAISIVTVQSLGSLVKSGEFKDFAQHIDALYVDECHHSGAATYTGLLNDLDHVFYRFGFSGTFLRNDNKELEMWSFLSNVLYRYPAHKAIEEGFLTPLTVAMHELHGKPNRKYQIEYDNHYCNNPELLDRVSQITTTYEESQILILVNRKDKCGLVIHEWLNSLGIENAYISGDNSKDEINNTISAFNDKKIRVLIGSSVIGEGIDVRSTDHLIMCQGGKSEITIVQAAGRVLRLFADKTHAFIHDFRFVGSKFMIKHADERMEIYQRNFQCEITHV